MTEPVLQPDAPAEHAPEVAALAKADPAAFELRARPQPAVRFRREMIIGAALLGTTAIAGVAWLGLKPVETSTSLPVQAQADPRPRAPDEALRNAPRGYGDIPRLGPPLPGDLGRPILEHQRSLAGEGRAAPIDDAGARAIQAEETERQRIATEHKAAREAGVMVATSGARAPAASPPVAAETLPAAPDQPDRAPDQAGKQAFLEQRGNGQTIDSGRLQAPALPNILSAGSILAASLVTGLDSDLPGFVIAQITQPVFDTPTGRTLLIPQGARLLGRYDSNVAFGQTRALVVWQRILMPDGSSIAVDNLPATDTQGYAGLADEVDLHSWQLLKGVGLSTLLGVGTQLTLREESDLVEALREAAQQSGARAGDRLVQRSLDVQPTIRVRPGWPLRVILHKDLVLPPWTGARP